MLPRVRRAVVRQATYRLAVRPGRDGGDEDYTVAKLDGMLPATRSGTPRAAHLRTTRPSATCSSSGRTRTKPNIRIVPQPV